MPSDWEFMVASIEDHQIEKIIKKILASGNEDKPIIVFISYVLMHLRNPIQSLSRIRASLPDKSKIVVRTSDDETAVVYPDNNQFKSILNPTIPDPTGGDRGHGGKLHYQLHQAGFKEVKMFLKPTMLPNLNGEDRRSVLEINYAWRADGLKQKVNSGLATDQEKKN